ncbi:hypothetical protein KR018_012636 [Drosophila ironensis]|nr:hypothetical protein KR018_012636 [Drosophila ironensis]
MPAKKKSRKSNLKYSQKFFMKARDNKTKEDKKRAILSRKELKKAIVKDTLARHKQIKKISPKKTSKKACAPKKNRTSTSSSSSSESMKKKKSTNLRVSDISMSSVSYDSEAFLELCRNPAKERVSLFLPGCEDLSARSKIPRLSEISMLSSNFDLDPSEISLKPSNEFITESWPSVPPKTKRPKPRSPKAKKKRPAKKRNPKCKPKKVLPLRKPKPGAPRIRKPMAALKRPANRTARAKKKTVNARRLRQRRN